ncbi:MAG TPA: class I SAM-dependent methyltransferase [Terracidiphilus sp.]|jgi:predicted O-methyltransferase YrrM|nr:class I SAM-dependent methyltransferase [Terracidiphilus sp.]
MANFEDDLRFIQVPAALPAIQARTEELKFNRASEVRTGSLLQLLAAAKPGGRFLELGTGTGMGAAWLLSGMDTASTLVSIEIDEGLQEVARQALGSDQRLKLMSCDAAGFLWRQPKKTFDLVFADATPGKYEALDEALAIVKIGGYYVIDDMLPQPNWPDGHEDKVSTLMDRLEGDQRFFKLALPWASGIVVLVRKPRKAVPLES